MDVSFRVPRLVFVVSDAGRRQIKFKRDVGTANIKSDNVGVAFAKCPRYFRPICAFAETTSDGYLTDLSVGKQLVAAIYETEADDSGGKIKVFANCLRF